MTTQFLMRPMHQNLPESPEPGSILVACGRCGRECWQRPSEPKPLPPGVEAVCTECGLRHGSGPQVGVSPAAAAAGKLPPAPAPEAIELACATLVTFVVANQAKAFTQTAYSAVNDEPVAVVIVLAAEPEQMTRILSALTAAVKDEGLTDIAPAAAAGGERP